MTKRPRRRSPRGLCRDGCCRCLSVLAFPERRRESWGRGAAVAGLRTLVGAAEGVCLSTKGLLGPPGLLLRASASDLRKRGGSALCF